MLEKKLLIDGKEVLCGIDFKQYIDNGVLACLLTFGDEFPCVVTINLPIPPRFKFGSYIDTNNYPDILPILKSNNFGILTEVYADSGFCTYPVFIFDKDIVKEANPEVYNDYVKMLEYFEKYK